MNSFHEVDTPSLLLDLQKLKTNINRVSGFAKDHGLKLRPHIKTHKSIKIAELQLESGAVGITTAKIEEAEVMASAGIKDILIAYPISSPEKIKRVIGLLNRGVDLKISVDSLEQIKLLQKGLESTPHSLEVWIKVNSGLNRCGVEPGKSALKLAQAVLFLSKLRVGGIFTHAGHAYGASTKEKIEEIALAEAKAVVESAEECEKAGIPIQVRSVGSTPTYEISGKVEGITEVRPGNAVFYDAIQVGLGVASHDDCALTVLASVVGVYEDRIVIDAGSKTLCLDKGAHGLDSVKGYGYILGHPGLIIERLSEEHGVVVFEEKPTLKLNDKVRIIPNHACTVVNQFDEYTLVDGERVVGNWKVDARGKNK
ncbi:D-serine deaminase-like pyridoxal phosphate-dependent protein [Bacillus tianshenii]|uniref:D-serine deaminase-like pyridoxal phosphate-dependent protein n=1 Tax=Sutcliffiella tianshenii TaxID=1463404 RepID=A0ABS2NZ00_9BACI|nr:D-TA family PLP-dependent enzyme [Bacillus tianshenii]MBM7619867.1 D-serine deaminase-like pyridoxal phosphate-dependent protein [Bacillus tianshenii]